MGEHSRMPDMAAMNESRLKQAAFMVGIAIAMAREDAVEVWELEDAWGELSRRHCCPPELSQTILEGYRAGRKHWPGDGQ